MQSYSNGGARSDWGAVEVPLPLGQPQTKQGFPRPETQLL